MPIKTTKKALGSEPASTVTSRTGQVVSVTKSLERRNMSDTLDYTDFQTVECTTALVYRGRSAPRYGWMPVSDQNPELPVPVEARFEELDVSNHFAWRGQAITTAVADPLWSWSAEMLEDYGAWKATVDEKARKAAERQAQEALRLAVEKAEKERNAVAVGKKMVVNSGRKVPKGTVGVVAFINRSGFALLKPVDRWQDRRADGVWVDPRHLIASA